MTEARLAPVNTPDGAQAVVLVLHGGGSPVSGARVSPTQLSVLRMVPIAHRIARRGPDLAVLRLLNSYRGWNTSHTPVDDVAWALDEVAARLGPMPVALVGHSLGGRAAILSARRERVRAVVALAPWVYADDGRVDATGVDVLVVHGTDDRIASPARSLAAATALRRTASSVRYVHVTGGTHSMLGKHARFSKPAADFCASVLSADPPSAALRAIDALPAESTS